MGIRDLQIIVSLLWRFFMEKKAKYSKELKLEIVKRYLKGESSVKLANEYEMSNMSGDIRKWAHMKYWVKMHLWFLILANHILKNSKNK